MQTAERVGLAQAREAGVADGLRGVPQRKTNGDRVLCDSCATSLPHMHWACPKADDSQVRYHPFYGLPVCDEAHPVRTRAALPPACVGLCMSMQPDHSCIVPGSSSMNMGRFVDLLLKCAGEVAYRHPVAPAVGSWVPTFWSDASSSGVPYRLLLTLP